MKNITLYFTMIAMSLAFIPLPTIAAAPTDNPVIDNLTPAEKAKVDSVLVRLNEIKVLAKSNLSSSERKSLRKEVRSLKHEMKAAAHGIYLSIGAVIIIILLLVLLL